MLNSASYRFSGSRKAEALTQLHIREHHHSNPAEAETGAGKERGEPVILGVLRAPFEADVEVKYELSVSE